MTAKEQNLYSFYVWCKKNGYENMQDETESLKAKVYATDLGIRYRDIGKLYKEAKAVYDAENKRKAHAEMLQNTDGQLLLVLEGNKEKISVYRREDLSVYCTLNDSNIKHEGLPGLKVEKSGTVLYDYHPSEAVYTGASSGGITMGGVHHTKAYMDEKVHYSGNGYIKASYGELNFTIEHIVFSDFIVEKFRRDDWFKAHIKDKKYIYCYDGYKRSNNVFKTTVGLNGNYYDMMTRASMAADNERLPMGVCKEIVEFLQRVFAGRYPASDEEFYQKAVAMESTAVTSKKIQECIELFEKISDFKDSQARADALKPKYKEVLQKEKEAAVLKKEANEEKAREFAKKGVKIAPFAIAALVLLIVVGKFVSNQMQLKSAYDDAMVLFEEEKYLDAKVAFEELENYKDSADLAHECDYQRALENVEIGYYGTAIKAFHALGDYSDAAQKIDEVYDLWIEEGEALIDAGDFDSAIEYYEQIMMFNYNFVQQMNTPEVGAGETAADSSVSDVARFEEMGITDSTPIVAECYEIIENIKLMQEEEEARIAEEAAQTALQIAFERKDPFAYAKYLDRFNQMTDDQLKEVIPGEWNVKSNFNAEYQFVFDKKGNMDQMSGQTKTMTKEFTIESDFLNFNNVPYAVYDVGRGCYLLVNSNTDAVGYLFWREIEEPEVTDEAIAEEVAEAAGK